jgi:N,N'-diacetyllegionaminate synthase
VSATRVTIIAEAGVNHDGDPARALALVDAAAAAGADVVKFQTFQADRLVTAAAPKAAYQRATTGDADSQHAMLRRLELSREAHDAIAERCRAQGVTFLSTPFDSESVDLLVAMGVRTFKVSSGDLTNLPLLRQIGRLGGTVWLSTGMATLDDVQAALDALAAAGTPRDRVTVLHCNTEYPTPMGDVNLRAMTTMRDALGVAVGYSDHTLGIEVPIAAVALGAQLIEKHFTLDRRLPGPDHQASLEPAEFAAMVTAIRHIELAMGDGHKRPTPSERENMAVARKSLVAACAIRAGETFTAANVTVKRPGTGLSPMRWDEVVGRTATRDYAADEVIAL